MDGKYLPQPRVSGDPSAPLSRISGDELESEMRRRWVEAPPTCESAHIYRHASVGLETCEKPPRRRPSRCSTARPQSHFCINNTHFQRPPLKAPSLPHFWAVTAPFLPVQTSFQAPRTGAVHGRLPPDRVQVAPRPLAS